MEQEKRPTGELSRLHPHSPTHTPVVLVFLPPQRPGGQEADLFRQTSSNVRVSYAAEAKVVVAVARVVRVAVGRPHVLRGVVPIAAPDDTVGASFDLLPDAIIACPPARCTSRVTLRFEALNRTAA